MVLVRDLVRAVQKRNKSLEEEYKELSIRISELNTQLQIKEKVIILHQLNCFIVHTRCGTCRPSCVVRYTRVIWTSS